MSTNKAKSTGLSDSELIVLRYAGEYEEGELTGGHEVNPGALSPEATQRNITEQLLGQQKLDEGSERCLAKFINSGMEGLRKRGLLDPLSNKLVDHEQYQGSSSLTTHQVLALRDMVIQELLPKRENYVLETLIYNTLMENPSGLKGFDLKSLVQRKSGIQGGPTFFAQRAMDFAIRGLGERVVLLYGKYYLAVNLDSTVL